MDDAEIRIDIYSDPFNGFVVATHRESGKTVTVHFGAAHDIKGRGRAVEVARKILSDCVVSVEKLDRWKFEGSGGR